MKSLYLLLCVLIVSFFTSNVYAATTPTLGQATTFGILSSTYTNTVGGTTITGDLGYTTGPAVAPTVSGTTHIADSTYTQAGTDQGSALSTLNAQTCDFNFGSATDLSLLSQPLTAGVYCITGAMSIGTGGITLGSGTYIFRSSGALNTVANSIISGGGPCDIFWTPGGATTLGANSTFKGTDIDNSGITIGSTVTWGGRALAFGGTISTDTDTITVPTCSTPSTPSSSNTSSNNNASSTSGNNSIPALICNQIKFAPTIINYHRNSPTSVHIFWSPSDGFVHDFIVQYGLTPVMMWDTVIHIESGNKNEMDLNWLPFGRFIWARVAGTQNGCIGNYGIWIDP